MHKNDALRSDQLVHPPSTFPPNNPGFLRLTPSIPTPTGSPSPNCPLSPYPAPIQTTDLGAQLSKDDNLQHSAPALTNISELIDENSAVTKRQNKSVNQDEKVPTVTSN